MSTDTDTIPVATASGFRLAPRSRKAVLTVHVASAVGLLGEVWGLVALNVFSALTADLELARSAYRLMPVLVAAGGIPLSLIALGTGITLALGSHWRLLRHVWVFAKLVLLIGVILVGMLLFQPDELAVAVQAPERPISLQWEQVVVLSCQLGMLLTATALSIVKPRTRFDRPLRRGTPLRSSR
jgi:hypothetical protein